jgi:hypothetical protein
MIWVKAGGPSRGPNLGAPSGSVRFGAGSGRSIGGSDRGRLGRLSIDCAGAQVEMSGDGDEGKKRRKSRGRQPPTATRRIRRTTATEQPDLGSRWDSALKSAPPRPHPPFQNQPQIPVGAISRKLQRECRALTCWFGAIVGSVGVRHAPIGQPESGPGWASKVSAAHTAADIPSAALGDSAARDGGGLLRRGSAGAPLPCVNPSLRPSF